ncbi:MAG TPA: hypothetical protein DCZ91_20655 [Lachnospiraceae bacterium]|nr:hypothetical protein [Lachnospiraceae bacterium]
MDFLHRASYSSSHSKNITDSTQLSINLLSTLSLLSVYHIQLTIPDSYDKLMDIQKKAGKQYVQESIHQLKGSGRSLAFYP